MCKCIFSKKLVFFKLSLKYICSIKDNFEQNLIKLSWNWIYLACSKTLLRMETLLGMFKNAIAHGNPSWHVQKRYCARKPYSACSKMLLRMETLLGMFKNVIAHGNPTWHVQNCYCAWKPYSACSKTLLCMETLLSMFKNVIAHGNPTLHVQKCYCAWKPYSLHVQKCYCSWKLETLLGIFKNVCCSQTLHLKKC